jgi:hypothetical protein
MFEFLKRKKIPWYKSYKTSKWPVIVDISLIFIVLALAIVFLSLYLFYPEKLPITKSVDIPNHQENNYEIDINNLPLEINYQLQENIIDRDNPQTTLELIIKNNSPVVINNVKINLNDYNIKSDKIVEIEKIAPDEVIQENVNLKFPVQKNVKPDLNIEYKILQQTIKDEIVLPEIRFKAKLNVDSMALYTANNGETLGLGPLPPVATLPTNYWVFFEVESLGDTEDFILSAKLADNVNYYGEYSLLAGNLNYNEDNKQLIWKIDEINEDEGKYRLGVEAQLIPTENQVGQLADLVQNIVYYANDKLTGEEISGSEENIDTNLKKDKFNSNSGIIKKE